MDEPQADPDAEPWEAAREGGSPEDRQFRLRSPLVEPSDELLAYAVPAFPPARPLASLRPSRYVTTRLWIQAATNPAANPHPNP